MNEEAIREARRLEADLASRISEGLIPPRPDAATQGEAHARWYDAHVRCALPGHRYFQRERGSRYCAHCIARGEAGAEAAAGAIAMQIPEFVAACKAHGLSSTLAMVGTTNPRARKPRAMP